jgi:hypothetical protein
VTKDWPADKMEAVEPESDADSMRPGPSTETSRRPHGETVMRGNVLEKIVKSEDSKRQYTARDAMFV